MAYIMSFTEMLWGWPLVTIIVAASVIFSIRLGFFQFTKFGFIMKNTIGTIFNKEEVAGEGNLTPFQAVSSALAGTIGVGNIAGVGVAIGFGGPGAVFWMWFVAILASVAKYAEITLGVKYRELDEETGIYRGGFMYMVPKRFGKNWKWLATAWSFLLFLQFTISGAVQSNAISGVMRASFNTSNDLMVGIVVAVLSAIVIIGGIKRIGVFAEKVVPTMATLYIVAALIIIGKNITEIPNVFRLILSSAFSGMAPVGGFVGATFATMIRNGFARGLYSNEAGMGTSPIAHATAATTHPAKQGLWGIFEVFADTIVVCSMTAFIILVTGAWDSGLAGAELTAQAFGKGLPGIGGYVVAFSTVIFAFTTILMAEYYAEIGGIYCFGNKISLPYRLIFVGVLVFGAIGGLELIWGLMDTFMGVTVAINLVVITIMSKEVVELTRDYFSSLQHSKNR